MSSRRRAPRRPRRVQVHFWRQGDPTAYIGYTTNISLTGMFVATNSPVSSGSRVRVEVVDRDRGFMVEGVVAHARKSPVELARLNQSGMGIRFLSVEELVRELMPAGLAGGTEEIPQEAAPRLGAPPLAAPPAAPAAAAAAGRDPGLSRRRAAAVASAFPAAGAATSRACQLSFSEARGAGAAGSAAAPASGPCGAVGRIVHGAFLRGRGIPGGLPPGHP